LSNLNTNTSDGRRQHAEISILLLITLQFDVVKLQSADYVIAGVK